MLPDRVSNPGPLTYETGALPIALRGPALQYYELTLNTIRSSLQAEVSFNACILQTKFGQNLFIHS